MPGIQDAAQFVIARQEGIGFVNQQRGSHNLDDAKNRRGADIAGEQRAHHQPIKDIEQCGLAAPRPR